MGNRNLATQITALEALADTQGVDLTFARRREPVAHWSINATSGAQLTDVSLLEGVTKMIGLLEPDTATPTANSPVPTLGLDANPDAASDGFHDAAKTAARDGTVSPLRSPKGGGSR